MSRKTSTHVTTLAEAQELLEQKDQELEQKQAAIAQHEEEIAKLRGRVDWLQRQMFGCKSEKLNPDDLVLFEGTQWLQDASQEAKKKPEPEPETEQVSYRRKKPSGRRKPLPPDLPRVTREHDLPEDEKYCPTTGKPKVKWIGQEVSEQLAYEPASCYVIRHVQHKYVRTEENLDGSEPEVVTADKPNEGLPKCIAAPSLLAAVVVSKFADHLPLYRVEGILQRSGHTSPRSTMCRWVQEVSELVAAIVFRMEISILASGTIKSDDTPVKQQEPGAGKTKTCRFWTYLGDGVTGGRYVVYRYTTDRSRTGPEDFFTDAGGKPRFHGNLQCDAYSGYGSLLAPDSKWQLTEIGCWAHARRKFYDIRKEFPEQAGWVLHKIGRLARVEELATRRNLSASQRFLFRARRARPIVDEIFDWCEKQSGRVLPKSKLSEAIEYIRNRGEALRRYLYDGHLDMDNNACERTLRGIGIGRKNWLFAGSEDGGHAAAMILSLIESCRLHGVDPLAYLTDVITRLPQSPPEEIDQFLPDRWAANHFETNS